MLYVVLLIGLVVVAYFVDAIFDRGLPVFFAGLICLTGFTIDRENRPEVHVEREAKAKAAAAKELADRTPHVIREADGCKVYRFMADDTWKYFTRCPGSTTSTQSDRKVSCGKNCTKTVSDVIETK